MGWLSSLFYGVDTDETQRTLDDTDAKIRALNEKRLASGSWTQATYDQSMQQLNAGQIDVNKQVSQAFTSEIKDRVGAAADGVNSGFNAVLSTVFRAVPWWVWLGAAAWFAWPYLGPYLIRRFAKR